MAALLRVGSPRSPEGGRSFEMTIPHCKPGQTRRDLHGAAACDCSPTIDIGSIELSKVKALHFVAGRTPAPLHEWVYSQDGTVDSWCPEDRCGSPFKIPTFCDTTEGERWFLFVITDSHFPSRFLVRGDNFEEAYENFIDANVNRLRIDTEHLVDYGVNLDDKSIDHDKLWDKFTGRHSATGVPVDTDNVTGGELYLTQIDLMP